MLGLLLLTAASQAAIELHVKPGGGAEHFVSVAAARDHLRTLRDANGELPVGGAIVLLHPGTVRVPGPPARRCKERRRTQSSTTLNRVRLCSTPRSRWTRRWTPAQPGRG